MHHILAAFVLLVSLCLGLVGSQETPPGLEELPACAVSQPNVGAGSIDSLAD